MIADKTGADLFEIRMEQPYTGDIYEVSQADLYNAYRPPLVGDVDVAAYDAVLLGYPTWWASVPMPVLGFLESHDFAGLPVASFSSHGGTRFGDSISDLGKTIPDALLGKPLEFYYSGGSDLSANIDAWLDGLGVSHV